LHFRESPTLAQYCFDFLKVVSPYTFKLLPAPPTCSHSPHSYQKENYFLSWQNETHPHEIHSAVRDALVEFRSSRVKPDDTSSDEDVLIFPLVQGGQFGIRDEEQAFQLLFQQIVTPKNPSLSRPLLDLTSGYFSLYKPYQNMILSASNMDCRIVAASPQVACYSFRLCVSVDDFLGQWILWIGWVVRAYSRRIYTIRTAIHPRGQTCRATLENYVKLPSRWTGGTS
jgi:CDP-diacylglycerol--glycerol-3-phosphate 3-phosphatidyltransferase